MLAKFRVLVIAILALVAVPETIFADDSAKVTALEELLKQYMDENAELKKVIAEQGTSEPEAGGDVVANDTAAPSESADVSERPELHSSEIVCERAQLDDDKLGLVVKICGVKKGANDASAAVDVVEEATTSPDSASETERLELYTSEIICERSKLNDNEYGLVVKMDAQKYADEAERRGLNCADDIEDANTKVDKVCRSNLTDCSDEVLCELSTHNDGSVKWRSGLAASGGYIEFVNEAQRRGLDCGVENPASSTKASYTCENDPAYCDNSQLCEAAVTRIGGSVSWSSDPNRRFFVSEAKNRNISCGLTYPLASCAGWNGTVAKIEGVDTENAVMSGYVMEKDFREYCTRDPGGETTTFGGELSIDQCVSKYFSVNKEQVVTFANCNTGELVNEWFLAGVKKTSKETFPLGIGTDRSCASGLLPLEAQFSMLCPSNANSDDWIAAGQQRKADAENLTSDAEEQKRLADEKQKKADADAQAAEQKQLADEEQIKADADAQAAEQKRLADDNAQSDAEYEKGASLYYDKDYQAAFDILMPLAEQGNPKAQNTIGMMYFLGYGVSQDDVAAEKWIKLAAEQGYLEAQSNLGDFYLYAEPLNSSEVLKWYRLAAEQGDGWSQMTLGLLFNKGKPGIPIDYEIAYAWLFLAQKNGESVQQMIDEVQSKMTPDAVNNAKRRVADCYDSSYKNCGWNEVSQKIEIEASVYAELERGASEFRNDNAQAGLKIVIPLAEGGDANSQAFLGILYLEGHTQYDGMGVPVDFVKAFKWLKLAASQGQPDAQLNLGEMYQFGNGVPQNKLRATMWYALAEENGSSYARKSLFDIQWSMEDWETAMIKTMIDNCKNSQYKDCGWQGGTNHGHI